MTPLLAPGRTGTLSTEDFRSIRALGRGGRKRGQGTQKQDSCKNTVLGTHLAEHSIFTGERRASARSCTHHNWRLPPNQPVSNPTGHLFWAEDRLPTTYTEEQRHSETGGRGRMKAHQEAMAGSVHTDAWTEKKKAPQRSAPLGVRWHSQPR